MIERHTFEDEIRESTDRPLGLTLALTSTQSTHTQQAKVRHPSKGIWRCRLSTNPLETWRVIVSEIRSLLGQYTSCSAATTNHGLCPAVDESKNCRVYHKSMIVAM